MTAPRNNSADAAPALVLNVGRLVLHHGGVGIIRTLGRMGVQVYATVDGRFTPAAVSRYLAGAFVWDTCHLDARRFLDGMAAIGRRLGRPTVLIPTGDVAAILVAEHAAELRQWFLFPPQPAGLSRAVANKKELYLLCQRLAVACPQSVFPTCLDDVRRFAARAAFPVVVKAAESWHLPKGGRTTSIARTPEQMLAIYQETESPRRPNLICQEFIDPARGEDWFYHGYRNERTNCCVGFTGRKLRSYPPFSGPTTLGQAVANDTLRLQAKALLEAINYGGIVDLDYRLDHRDGQYKLLDFNPRIGAQFRLFETHAGVDVARALYLDQTGRAVPAAEMVEGRTFIAEFHDIAACVGYFRRARLTFREWRESLRGRRELAWFARDDLLPFATMSVRLAFRVAERLLRLHPLPHVAHGPPRFVGRSPTRAAATAQPSGGGTPIKAFRPRSPAGVRA